ncbi:hypothetical protein V496_08913 [Pseudogymnoascus sp. VKM F-4515 (FW-2607)]|nr:hypothetical protein V496_08913 [Pseudogymnoascus sp. VKM F-4515 (FW-2607)]
MSDAPAAAALDGLEAEAVKITVDDRRPATMKSSKEEREEFYYGMDSSELRASVRAVMSDIAWHAIDIVRVGNKDDAVHPPVILITAAASEIDNEAAQIAVQQIHDLMVHGNGTDVRFGLEITYVAPFEWLLDNTMDTLKTRDVVIGQGKEEIGVEKAGKEVGVEKGN